jgi:hypothetical protein
LDIPFKPDCKKARCTIDGSKRWRRNMQLGQIYANSLATDSECLFWAIAAKRGLVVVGADVSNAFAEAPAPGNTFYVIPDHIFHYWWVNHKKRQPIPPGWVLRVKFSLQGHPESPRLWEQHIRKILTGKQGYQCIMNAVYTKQSYMDTGPCYYDKWMTLPLQRNLKLLVGTLSTILTSIYASGLNT